MPIRPLSRERTWLFPPTLEELIPGDHPARFVAAFVDQLDRGSWGAMDIAVDGEPLGAPAYDPRGLLCVWLYGFMTGTRSCRKLEAACRDQVPYLWLTSWEHPDHNTLWRFYQAHRRQMRVLFKRTVKTAVRMGLVDLAVQAVDGTKIPGNAARARVHDEAGLRQLLERADAAIAELEAQNEAGDDPPPPRLPEDLASVQALHARVQAALEQVIAEDGPKHVNLTDADARLIKGPNGYLAGYNAQVMVSPLVPETAGRTGLFITAEDVTGASDDHGQLLPMVQQMEENTGDRAKLTLADGGYHSGETLVACEEAKCTVVMPEAGRRGSTEGDPYHRDEFVYDEQADRYICPQGQTLHFAGERQRKRRAGIRIYRASPAICRVCPAFGVCTKDWRHGRVLEATPYESALRRHRVWMASDEAKSAYRQRKQLPEPVFGILKEGHGARRFLLRGLKDVQAEWALLTTAFNLQTLYRIWAAWQAKERGAMLCSAPV